jgi:uncharacterized membrane protein YbhN (UPF0104 family)
VAWRRVIGWVVLALIVVTPLVSLWLRKRDVRANRIRRAQEAQQLTFVKDRLDLLEGLLIVWAETWGDPVPVVKARLQALMSKHRRIEPSHNKEQ